MYGNYHGWMMSGTLIIVTFIGVYMVNAKRHITETTQWGRNAVLMPELKFDQPTPPIVTMDQPGNAGQLYHQALAAFREQGQRSACEKFKMEPAGTPPQAIQLVLDAANCVPGPVFTTAELVKYVIYDPHDDMSDLSDLSDDIGLAGFRLVAGHNPNRDEGLRYAKAQYSLGWRLFQERLVCRECVAGVAAMEGALETLTKAAGIDSDAGKSLKSDHDKLSKLDKALHDICDTIQQPGDKTFAEHGGDILLIAAHAKERMYRTEAILNLGRSKFNTGTNDPDVMAAIAYIKVLADDASLDPASRAAAVLARDLTQQDFENTRFQP